MDTLELRPISVMNPNPKELVIGDYVEFYVNGEPLSELLEDYFGSKEPLLSKYTSTLGTMELTNFDRLKIRQLLAQPTGQAELEKLFPASQFDHTQILEELKLEKVLVYCCAECGDFKCGGYFARIIKNPDSFEWIFEDKGKKLKFRFEAKAYREEFDSYLEELD